MGRLFCASTFIFQIAIENTNNEATTCSLQKEKGGAKRNGGLIGSPKYICFFARADAAKRRETLNILQKRFDLLSHEHLIARFFVTQMLRKAFLLCNSILRKCHKCRYVHIHGAGVFREINIREEG